MRVWLSAPELAARGLTTQDVVAAIRSRNVEIPAGRIESERREFSVRSLGELKTPTEFANLVVANIAGQLVKLGDVAKVELGAEDDRSRFRFNGKAAVGVSITRQSKSNLIEVSDAVMAALPGLQASLPPGVKLDLGYDSSTFVKQAIQQLQAVLAENRDNLAAQQFIDPHYQEIVELFKDGDNADVFKILKALNPDRADIYDEYIK